MKTFKEYINTIVETTDIDVKKHLNQRSWGYHDQIPVAIELWYDYNTKDWVMYLIDDKNNVASDTEYSSHKPTKQQIINFASYYGIPTPIKVLVNRKWKIIN